MALATMGNWVRTSNSVAARADATSAGVPHAHRNFAQVETLQELGYALETVAPGVNVVCKILMPGK